MNPVAPVLAIALLLPTGALAEGMTGHVAWVIDGDTFRLTSGERIRIRTAARVFLEAVMDLEAGLIHPLLDEHLPQVVSV